MNILTVNQIKRVGDSRIEYKYTVEGEWSYYFNKSEYMWVEYSTMVKNVPDSVAVIPFIGNVIVFASLMDADIYVDEIDKEFYESIENFIHGFSEIMPKHVRFKEKELVHAKRIVENHIDEKKVKENMLFFSGGVDATSSLISHLSEKPALVSVWGADVPWSEEKQWERLVGFNKVIAAYHDLKLHTIRSNFRSVFQDDYINDFSMELVGNWWWVSFHFGIAMHSIAAPLAYGKYKKLYFSSSIKAEERKDEFVIGSDIKIDNHVRFCGSRIIHDGCEFARYDKVERICQYYKSHTYKPYLRVCYSSHEGENCSMCAKCTRTMMMILLAGFDTKDYGFSDSDNNFYVNFVAGMQEVARTSEKGAFLDHFKYIHAVYRKKFHRDQIPSIMGIFYDVDISDLYEFLSVPNNEYIKKSKRAKEIETELYVEIGQLKYHMESENCVLKTQIDELNEKLSAAEKTIKSKYEMERELHYVYNSKCWKITAPLRKLRNFLKVDVYALKQQLYNWGMNRIRKRIPEGCWKHDYIKWRWWFICSDHYMTRFKSRFKQLLNDYTGKIRIPLKLVEFDYWMCWIFLGAEPDDYFDYEFFKKGWKWRNNHITRQRLNFIDPIFNDNEKKFILNDKLVFCEKWEKYIKRKWCNPKKISYEEFCELFSGVERILIKPCKANGGQGIYAINLFERDFREVYNELSNSEEYVIVEEFVNQKGFLNKIYPMSLNPLRVTTIRIGDEIEILYSFFTTGRSGMIIANDCVKGICFPIETETGRLGVGQGTSSNEHFEHPDTGVKVAGEYIPEWEKIKEFAREVHKNAPEGLDLIGWDICWNDGVLSLIEGNSGPGFPELPNKNDEQWKRVMKYLDKRMVSAQ